MTQSSVNLPLTGSGDTSAKAAVKKLSTNEVVQQVELVTAVDGGALTPIASGNPLEVAIVGTVPISGAPTTVTANIGTTNGLGLDSSLQSILTKLNASVGVTGTFWQATQPVSGTFWQATQPVSGTVTANLGTLNGAATAAKQPALGTAGSASSDVLTIQGISGGTAIPVTGGGVPTDSQLSQTLSSVTTSTALTGLNGIATAVVEIISTGNTATGVTWGVQGSQDGTNWEFLPWMTSATTLALNAGTVGISNLAGFYYFMAAGFAQIRLNVAAISTGNFPFNIRTTVAPVNSRSFTSVITGTPTINLSTIAGTATATGHGTTSAGVQRVELPTDGTGVVGLNAGANLVGKVGIDQTTSGTTNAVALVPVATGGLTVSRLIAAGSTNATSVKTSAGQVYGWYLGNAAAYPVFLKLYNKASAPTVGTDTPLMTIPVPAGGGANVNFTPGIAFSTGIAFAITKLVADTDTTVVVASDLVVNLVYA